MLGLELNLSAQEWAAEVEGDLDRLSRVVRSGQPVDPQRVALLGALSSHLRAVARLSACLAGRESFPGKPTERGG